MDKQMLAMIGVIIPIAIFASSMVTTSVSDLNHDLDAHADKPCHDVACLQLEELKKLQQENHCINVKQIKGEDPLDCL